MPVKLTGNIQAKSSVFTREQCLVLPL